MKHLGLLFLAVWLTLGLQAQIPGTVELTATIAPAATNSPFGVQTPRYGIGGLLTGASSLSQLQDLNWYPLARRHPFMIATVTNTGAQYINDLTLTNWYNTGSVSNMAQLRLIEPATVGGVVTVGNYGNSDDCGGGTYTLVSTITGTNALGGKILALGGTMSWQVEPVNGAINVRQFGAVGDGVTNDRDPINAAALYATSVTPLLITFVPAGNYGVSNSINLPSNSYLKGAGPDLSIFVRLHTNLYAPFATIRNLNFASPSETNPNFTVPANNTNIQVTGIGIKPYDTNRYGQGMSFWGVHGLKLDNNIVYRSVEDFAFNCWAQDATFTRCNVYSNTVIHEDGIHVNGFYITVSDCVLHTGDDMTAVGESQDIASRYITFSNITGSSQQGQIARIVSSINQGNGSTFIEDIDWVNLSGDTGRDRNGGIYFAEDGLPRGAFRNINIANVTVTVNNVLFTNKTGTLLHSIYVRGGSNVNIRNVTSSGAFYNPIVVDLPHGPVSFDGVRVGQSVNGYDAVYVSSGRGQSIEFINCRIDGLNSPTNVFNIDQADFRLFNTDVYGTNVYIQMRQNTNASRITWVQNNRFWGPGVTPWSSVGSQPFMLDFRFTGNWLQTNSAFPSGLVFAGNTEFGPNVKIDDNSGLGEQNRITRNNGNNTYVWGSGASGSSAIIMVAGNATDRTLTIQNANIDATSSGAVTNLVLNGNGGHVQLGPPNSTYGVVIGAGTPIDTAQLTVTSGGAKGFLVTAMTKAQRDAIVSPANGLMIYQSDSLNYGPRYYSTTLAGWMKPDGTPDP